MSDYISREDAVDELQVKVFHNLTDEYYGTMQVLTELTAADVVPYSISPDGTVTITVPKGTYKKINRVLVEEDGTHWGGLYYAD